MARRSGLGKGLDALIPSDAAGGGVLRELPIDGIVPNRYQPREHFDDETIESLAASIRELGVLQPVLVRPVDDEDRYELVAGERRWRAARAAGLTDIPALVRDGDELASLEQALVENLHREDLTALEEAAAYQQLVDDFHLTQEELARRVGRSRSTVANTMRLLHLPAKIQKLLVDGRLSAGHARALLGTDDRAFQESLARRAADEGLTVRAVEDAIRARNGPSVKTEGATGGGAAPRPAGLLELEELLADHLDTRVAVSMGANRGKVVIEFAGLDDLERIFRLVTSVNKV